MGIVSQGVTNGEGKYPTSGYSELLVVLRYEDSGQAEFYNIPCINGGIPWFAASDTNWCYLGQGDIHNAKPANYIKYGAWFSNFGTFKAMSLTAVYIYGRKIIV
jgi:hypothetical protein